MDLKDGLYITFVTICRHWPFCFMHFLWLIDNIFLFCPLRGDKEVDSLLSLQEKCHIPKMVYIDRQKTNIIFMGQSNVLRATPAVIVSPSSPAWSIKIIGFCSVRSLESAMV
ncbi:transmembrane protein, putative [Medicago truncatula]|uniref:Transmembrane protein, putative n=1 Tax=Medicago truncatula TaxID=3880 RepID=A0A072UMF2_MEDTR|nr:transmembrane protein, putative [Medicago truncatula]